MVEEQEKEIASTAAKPAEKTEEPSVAPESLKVEEEPDFDDLDGEHEPRILSLRH